MVHDVKTPIFGISDKARLKPVSSATETCQKVEISLVASFDMILSNTEITKVLIRLHRLVWVFVVHNPPDRFSHMKAHIQVHFKIDFFIEANNMNSDLSPYCLQYWLPINKSR